MRKKAYFGMMIAGVAGAEGPEEVSMKTQALNPFLPGYEYIPDGEPHVFGDRVYIFGSHDRFGGKKFCMNDYVTWSAPIDDLGDWRYEGVIYRKRQDPDNPKGKLELWAPDVVQGADGRYYLYYCLANYPAIGVAVADSPTGPYEYLDHVHDKKGAVIGKREVDTCPFDPAVLVDTDGRVWLYSGNAPRYPQDDPEGMRGSMVMELERDMVTVASEPRPLIPLVTNSEDTGFEGHEFFEASSIRKFGNRYYFVYSSVLCHELCWAVSDRPDGGFVYGGILVSNGDIRKDAPVAKEALKEVNPAVKNYTGNNHGGLVQIRGQYYIFYHRHSNRTMYSRQACAEEIKMLPDGSFVQAELTSCGLNGGPLEGKGTYRACIACHLHSAKGATFSKGSKIRAKIHPFFTQEGKDRERVPAQYIANMRDGATAGFKYFRFENAKKIRIRARGKGTGFMAVRTKEGELPAAIIVLDLEKDWKSFSANLHVPDGVHALYFTFEGKGFLDFWDFKLS